MVKQRRNDPARKLVALRPRDVGTQLKALKVPLSQVGSESGHRDLKFSGP